MHNVKMEDPTCDNRGSMKKRIRRRGGLARTLAKMGHGIGKKKGHPRIKALVSTIVFSLSKEALQYLKGPEGEAAMADITTCLAHAISRFVVSEDARQAIRVMAEEATTGLCDGLGFKAQELAMEAPRFVLVMVMFVVGAYAALLAVGLLLCLWRFSLYGLVQEKPATLCRSHDSCFEFVV